MALTAYLHGEVATCAPPASPLSVTWEISVAWESQLASSVG